MPPATLALSTRAASRFHGACHSRAGAPSSTAIRSARCILARSRLFEVSSRRPLGGPLLRVGGPPVRTREATRRSYECSLAMWVWQAGWVRGGWVGRPGLDTRAGSEGHQNRQDLTTAGAVQAARLVGSRSFKPSFLIVLDRLVRGTQVIRIRPSCPLSFIRILVSLVLSLLMSLL